MWRDPEACYDVAVKNRYDPDHPPTPNLSDDQLERHEHETDVEYNSRIDNLRDTAREDDLLHYNAWLALNRTTPNILVLYGESTSFWTDVSYNTDSFGVPCN